MNMATSKKKKTKKKKTGQSITKKVQLPSESVVDRLTRELMNLPMKDQLAVIGSRGLGVSIDTDNYGQIIIYTDMMYGDNDDVVAFEVECPKDHVEDFEEEYECEF